MRRCCLWFFMVCMINLNGQNIDIGLSFGASWYNGDLSPQGITNLIQEMGPTFGLFGRTSLNRQFSIRANFNIAKISGDDKRSAFVDRGLSFQTNIYELNVILEWHAIRIRHTESSFTFPYLFAGIGGYHFNPKANLNEELIALRPLGTEGQGLPGNNGKYALFQGNIPFGAGIKFVLSDRVTVALEIGGRFLFTDYLDDVSNVLVDYQQVLEGNGPTAAFFSNPNLNPETDLGATYTRGSEFKDWYYLGTLLVSYNFGSALRKFFRNPVPCPKF